MRPEMELALLAGRGRTAAIRATIGPMWPWPSLEGVLVNQHLGEAEQLSIFAREESGFRLVEMPPHAAAGRRSAALARPGRHAARLPGGVGGQCRASRRARRSPAKGIKLVMMEGLIEEGLDAVYRGAEIRAPLRTNIAAAAGRCAGNGQGCTEKRSQKLESEAIRSVPDF